MISYRLVVKGSLFDANDAVVKRFPIGTKVENVRPVSDTYKDSIIRVSHEVDLINEIGKWFAETVKAPFPTGALLFFSKE